MYGKIFDSIYDSTVADDWRALVTFMHMVILCDADGVVDMTPQSISRRTGMPIEHIEAGLKILEDPDPYSRTPDQEGRRIERLDEHRPWGWSIVNHAHYKGLRDAESVREQNRVRQNRKRLKEKETCHAKNVTERDSHAKSHHTDTDTDTDKKKRVVRFAPPTLEDVTNYWLTKPLAGNPETFFDHFTSNGWKVGGKAAMKDWKAAARNWSRRENEGKAASEIPSGRDTHPGAL